jgi:TrmH family RNA methyltransferase
MILTMDRPAAGERLPRLGRHGARLKALRQRVRCRRPGEVVVDGRRLVADLVRWGAPLREIYLAASLADQREMVLLAAAAGERWAVDDAVLAAIAPTHHPQGVLAIVPEPCLEPWSRRQGIALFLDRVQDPGNVGGMVRSAAALGAGGVFLSPGCADPFHPAAVRGSCGAVFRLPVEREVDLAGVVDVLRACGGEAWAAAVTGVPVERWRPGSPVILLLGSEGQGLGREALACADGSVTVPLERGVDSLNVGVAAGVLLHAYRQRS